MVLLCLVHKGHNETFVRGGTWKPTNAANYTFDLFISFVKESNSEFPLV